MSKKGKTPSDVGITLACFSWLLILFFIAGPIVAHYTYDCWYLPFKIFGMLAGIFIVIAGVLIGTQLAFEATARFMDRLFN